MPSRLLSAGHEPSVSDIDLVIEGDPTAATSLERFPLAQSCRVVPLDLTLPSR